MKTVTFISALLLASTTVQAQPKAEGYQFTTVVNQKVTPVKNQALPVPAGALPLPLSSKPNSCVREKVNSTSQEMYIVRQKYMNQLNDNYLRHGNGNIGQGSISPSWFTAFTQVGIVPEEVYSGINYNSPTHNHKELASYMEAIAGKAVQMRQRSPEYDKLIKSLFDIYMGELPEKFTYKGKEYTPQSFAQSLDIHPEDYVMLTSFTHKPYYQAFEVEIPDNWEHAKMYNLPLDEMMEATDYALKNGYTVCWDWRRQRKRFLFQARVAINPETGKTEDLKDTDFARWQGMDAQERLNEAFKFEYPCPEVKVTPEIRQKGYESL